MQTSRTSRRLTRHDRCKCARVRGFAKATSRRKEMVRRERETLEEATDNRRMRMIGFGDYRGRNRDANKRRIN